VSSCLIIDIGSAVTRRAFLLAMVAKTRFNIRLNGIRPRAGQYNLELIIWLGKNGMFG